MPNIIITGPPLVDVEKKRILAGKLVQTASENYGRPKCEVSLFIIETSIENIAPGGVLVSDHDPREDRELVCIANMVLAELEGPPLYDDSNEKKRVIVAEVTQAIVEAYSLSSPHHLTIRITENSGNIIGNGGVLLIDKNNL